MNVREWLLTILNDKVEEDQLPEEKIKAEHEEDDDYYQLTHMDIAARDN
jgi:hypothetical protein